jgi:hypothetical protein
MSTLHSESRRRRVHSAGERVVLAIAVATPGGIGSLTIRVLAQHLGVKPMAIRARLLTTPSCPYASDLGSLPKLNCRIPCMSPHAATQPPLVIASGAASGIPQQPLPAVASELAVVRRSDREPNWEPYATTIRARIRIDPDTARAWSAPPDHSSDDAGRMIANYGSDGRPASPRNSLRSDRD